jgi:regulator of sigma E protease
MLLTLLAFGVVLGVLIVVHELGHFIAAKAVGIQVIRFSIGFGPPIFSWRRGETEYRLAWIPLGGYVKMAGLEDEGMAGDLEGGAEGVTVDPARAFDRKPVWARIIVLTAGVAMNALLAFVIYTSLTAVVGTPQRATTQVDSVMTAELPPGAETMGTLQFGDRIVRVNGDTVRSWNDIVAGIFDSTVTELRFDVAGRAEPVVAQLGDGSRETRTALTRAVVFLTAPKLGLVEPGRPAARAGLRVGDVILRADGDTVRSWRQLVGIVRRSPGRELKFDVLRGATVVPVTVVPDTRGPADTVGGGRAGEGVMGATEAPERVYVRESVGSAVAGAARQTVGASLAIVYFLGRLVSGDEPLRQLGGPVLIGQISGQVIRMGVYDFLAFLAFFSVQLAVLNLLPIPVLDGGHLVFLLIEGLRGKPIPLNVRVRLLNVGFWILIAIMVLAVGNDVIFRLLPR